MLRVVPEDDARQEFALALDEICRRGAERMLAIALEAEVETYLECHREARDGRGRALVVRNGSARGRTVVAGAGAIEVAAPRVNDRRVDPATGERSRFRSSILPPYARRSPKVAEVLPLLYLHGLSTKDFVPALAEFFGSSAGLSAAAITRLTASWSAERETFMSRDLSEVDYVYCWVDGVHFTVRLGEEERTLVAGLQGQYPPEALIGKKVAVVANLKPARIQGIQSQGMVLAAEDSEGRIVLLTPDKDIPPGAKIR